MRTSTNRDCFDAADCDLIAYLAARVGVSELEALDRLGDCLLEQSPELRPWTDLEMHVLKTPLQHACDSALASVKTRT